MRRQHPVTLDDHSPISPEHPAEPRNRPRIRRIAVIRSDSQGFRIVSKPRAQISPTRP
jgi:hypothetical protein